jgi:RNA polymerase sigma-70 factor (ECF subfamily)
MPAKKFTLTPEQIQALRGGDREVFRRLYFEFQPRLYRFLWLKLRSVERAEDLAQETFLRLWETRERLRADGNLEIYLFRIAGNLATDALRAQQRRPPTTPLETTPLFDSRTAEGAIEYQELARRIEALVSQLPEGPKTAFLLSRYEELSHAEIGAIMGLSVKTVEKHIGKALQTLRAGLGI